MKAFNYLTKTRWLVTIMLLFSLSIGQMWGYTYTQLTSIANIDQYAVYVLGVEGSGSGKGFHYSGTSSWGLTAAPASQTPLYYTLVPNNNNTNFKAYTTISNTTYYLQVPTSNTFSMNANSTAANTTLIIGTTQVSGTNYAVANSSTTARHLRINGTSGLRSYAGTTGSMAFFYVVRCANPTSLTNGTIASSTAHLSWTDAANTNKYEVYISTSSTAPGSDATPTATVTDQKYADITSGLSTSTTYNWWVRAKDKNNSAITSDWVAGTAFTTTSGASCAVDPTVSASSNGSINVTGGTVSCMGITKGDCDIDEWGFVYGTATEPTGNAQKVSSGKSTTDVSSFNKTLTGLDPNVKYYVRAYAKVGSSTFYGSETNFTTKTITASSSNTTYGTISRSKMVITGSPKSGGQYASPAYTVTGSTPANATTVTQSGNTFTVTSTSTTNITVTINFEAIPTYTVTWVAGSNSSFNSQTGTAGTALTDPGTPSAASYCPGGKVFVGWTATPIDGEQNSAPADLFTSVSGKSIPSGGTTYYAVFAEVSGELSNSYAPITSGLETANYVIAYSYNGGTQIVLQNTADNSSPSDKLEGYNLSLSDSKYSNPAASYIWELRAQSDGSYYIYNTAVEKYVNATTTPALTLSTTPTKFTITYDGTNSRWTIQIKESTSYYIHGYVNGSTYDFRCSTSGSGARYKIYLYKQESNITYAKYSTTCSTDPELSVTPTALDFGNVANGTYKEMTFSLSGTHLTANASIAVSGTNSGYFTVTPNSVDKGSGTISATNITVRYTPGAVADGHTATVTVSSTGAEPQTVTLTGNCKASYSVTVTPPTNGTVTADKTTNVMAGETVTLTITPSSGYYLSAISANSGAVSLSGDGDTRTFTMPAGNVTITATFAERVDYVLVKDVNDLYEDASVVICNKGEVEQYARVVGAYADGNNWPAISASVFSDGGVLKILESTAYMQKFTLKAGTTDGTWAFYDGTGYIKAASSSNNYMKRESPKTDNSSFAITINTTTGLASVVSQGTNTHNAMDYNAGNTLFSCYTSATGVYIYIIPASCERLAAPTDLTASSITKTTCTLSWNSVTNASGYEISLDNGSSWTSTSTSTSYNATGLTAGTTYNWKVRATGDGDTYCAKGNAASSTVTMKNAVTVTYNDNGKTSGSVPATANLIEGDSYTVAGNTGTLVKDGYTWAGWHNSTTYNATPAYGTGGSTITVNSSIILYANWAPKRDTFIDGVHGNATQYGDGSYTVPSCSNATRHTTGTCEETHYKFIGWALSGADLTNQANIISAGGSKNATNATYYAVWAEEL